MKYQSTSKNSIKKLILTTSFFLVLSLSSFAQVAVSNASSMIQFNGVNYILSDDILASSQVIQITKDLSQPVRDSAKNNKDIVQLVNCSDLVKVFVEAYKEQQDVIDDLSTQNTDLQKRMKALEKKFSSFVFAWGGEIDE